jgi:hypothetical protein
MMDRDTGKSAPLNTPQTALVVASNAGTSRDDMRPGTPFAITRPDSSFVTHLIATAAQMPQTRTLRRASPEYALSSYRSVANQNKPYARSSGTSRVA